MKAYADSSFIVALYVQQQNWSLPMERAGNSLLPKSRRPTA